MRPYLVHKTWVDLDHVLAIGSEVGIQVAIAGPRFSCSHEYATIDVEMMFRDGLVRFNLSEVHWAGGEESTKVNRAAVDKVLADFIAEWKQGARLR